MNSMVLSKAAFRVVDFDTFAIPVHRIVSMMRAGDGGTVVRYIDADDTTLQSTSKVAYKDAVDRYQTQAQ